MMLAFVAESLLAGQHVSESPWRAVLSVREVLDSSGRMVMVNTSDSTIRNIQSGGHSSPQD